MECEKCEIDCIESFFDYFEEKVTAETHFTCAGFDKFDSHKQAMLSTDFNMLDWAVRLRLCVKKRTIELPVLSGVTKRCPTQWQSLEDLGHTPA